MRAGVEHGRRAPAIPYPLPEKFRACLPVFEPAANSRKLDLLDHPRLLTQLVGLERRTSRGGRDFIDHAPGAHDDLANAAAGVAAATNRGKYRYDSTLSWVS